MNAYNYNPTDKSSDMFYDEQLESLSSLAEFQYFKMLEEQAKLEEEDARISWENYMAQFYALDVV